MRLPIVNFASEKQNRAYAQYFDHVCSINPGSSSSNSTYSRLPTANAASELFSKSGLPRQSLLKIWDMIHQKSMSSSMDQNSFNVGLRLIAIAQHQIRQHYHSLANLQFENDQKYGALKQAIDVSSYRGMMILPGFLNLNLMSLDEGNSWVPWFEGFEEVWVQTGYFLESDMNESQPSVDGFRANFMVSPVDMDNWLQPSFHGLEFVDDHVSKSSALDFFLKSQLNRPILIAIFNLLKLENKHKLSKYEFCVFVFWIFECKAVISRSFALSPEMLPKALLIDLIPPNSRPKVKDYSVAKLEISPPSPTDEPSTAVHSQYQPEQEPGKSDSFDWDIPAPTRDQYAKYFEQLRHAVGGSENLISRSCLGLISDKTGVAMVLCQEAWLLVAQSSKHISYDQFIYLMWILDKANQGVMIPLKLPDALTFQSSVHTQASMHQSTTSQLNEPSRRSISDTDKSIVHKVQKSIQPSHFKAKLSLRRMLLRLLETKLREYQKSLEHFKSTQLSDISNT